MTINEAIKELMESYNFWMEFVCDDVLEEREHKVNNCEKNANYCYQLIQWLEELKYHKSLLENAKTTNPMYEIGYSKAIEDFSKKIVSRKEDFEEYYLNDRKSIALANIAIAEANIYLEMAEQLKDGVENEID